MKHFFALTLITLSTAFSAASALERCDDRFAGLYKEIQIFNRTERIAPGLGEIGATLQNQIGYLKGDLSVKEKVQALETGFAKCDIELSEKDVFEIDMAEEALIKMQNPLITD